MQKILLSHALYKDGMDELEGKADVEIADNGDSDVILDKLSRADGFILRIGKIDRKAIMACDRLKVIARPGIGVDNVDVAAATERGIPVVVAPKANSRSVAEHAMALLLAIAKNIVESDRETRRGNFRIREKYAATELSGRTAGLVGFGNVGSIFAGMCRGFGLRVCVFDPYVPSQRIREAGCEPMASLDDLLRIADLVSLHCPATPETRGMIDAQRLGLMKPSAFLVNTARGDLVVEADLGSCLAGRRIAGAAVDVLSEEPMKAGHLLFGLDNFVVSPHIAAQTPEATARAVVMAARGTLAVLAGERWPHVVNPEAFEHARWKATKA